MADDSGRGGMRRTAIFVIVALTLGATARAEVTLQRWEHGVAQIQVNRVRMLTQRLAKQHALYQLGSVGARRVDMIKTVEAIDEAIVQLERGDSTFGVPEPPTPEIGEKIARLDTAWGSLRMIADAGPADYARRAGIGSVTGTGDPLRIRTFDAQVDAVDARARAVSEAYVALCAPAQRRDCEGIARATNLGILSERIAKEAVLLHAGIDVDEHRGKLVRTRDAFAKALAATAEQEVVQAAMADSRGRTGEIMQGIWADIGRDWSRLAGDVDRLVAGSGGEVDLVATLEVQRVLLEEMQRFQVAVRRFATARRLRTARS